ncbi:uncharacterized protein Tco025E_09153 [Trypanosoma conorhini]|uniref:Uncharacterized protein n=1 Tax=Trypanosoma conorhini TaxID=83891 RepID=A0A422N014_9TRYP|nr:uncharacterized protein Tco025E_09153 [Trypanosoma conorhini]RNE98818.1 hypothetical protein Tco025E_09153 [Trypanosoma conorhini]
MQLVGPMPRDNFSAAAFDGRTAAGDGALQATDAPVAEDDCAREGEKLWGAGNPFRRAEKIERECGAHGAEAVRHTNVCRLFDLRIGTRLRVGFWAPARVSRGYGVPLAFLKSSRSRVPRTHTHTRWGRRAFCGHGVEKIGRGSRGCGRQRDGGQSAACCGRRLSDVGAAGAVRLRGWSQRAGSCAGAATEDALLLGASFFYCFLSSPRAGRSLFGLRFAAAGAHHNTTASAAQQRPSE